MGCSSSTKIEKVKDSSTIDIPNKDYQLYVCIREIANITFSCFEGKEIKKYLLDSKESDVNPFANQTVQGLFLYLSPKYNVPIAIWTPWGKWTFVEISKDIEKERKFPILASGSLLNNQTFLESEPKEIMNKLCRRLTLTLCKPFKSVYAITRVDEVKLVEEKPMYEGVVLDAHIDAGSCLELWGKMRAKYKANSPISIATTINSRKASTMSNPEEPGHDG